MFDPRAQIICYLCFITGVILVIDWPVLAALCVIPGALAVGARVRWRDARPFVLWLLFYVAFFTPIFLLLQGQTTEFIVRNALQLLAGLLATVVIVRTFDPRAGALAWHGLWFPDKLAFTFSLKLRYVVIIRGDIEAAKAAQMARGLELDGRRRGFVRRARSLASILSSVLVRAISESRDMENALDLRGFGARSRRTWLGELRWRPRDVAAIVAALGLLTGLLVYYLPRHGAVIPVATG